MQAEEQVACRGGMRAFGIEVREEFGDDKKKA